MIPLGMACFALDAEYTRISDRSHGWVLNSSLELALIPIGSEVAWMSVSRISNAESVRHIYRTDPDWADVEWMLRWVREAVILGAL